MYVVVESWRAKPEFLALEPAQREALFDEVKKAMGEMAAGGIETLGWGNVDGTDEPHGSGHDWFAVWTMPNAAAGQAFLAGVKASGWYDWFEQTNVVGELRPAQDIMAEHVTAE